MVWTVKPDKMEISPLKAYFMMIKAGYKFYRICQLDRMKENEIFSFTGAAIIKLANVSFGQKSLDVDFMICAQPPLPHSLSFFFLSLLWSPFFPFLFLSITSFFSHCHSVWLLYFSRPHSYGPTGHCRLTFTSVCQHNKLTTV